MKRFNPYKRLPYSCAWCHSSNTHIIDRPKDAHRDDNRDEFYYKRDPRKDTHRHIDDDIYGFPRNDRPKYNEDNEYINERDKFDERDDIPLSNNFIIDCYDCAKYSQVYIQKCINCSKSKINTTRISNFIDTENRFDFRQSNYTCVECHYIHYKPTPVCNHNYVRYSGEIFSIGAVITLKCTHCGAEKTSYPNNDNPHQPYNDNYPNGDGTGY
jgi:hypothetical protein